MKRLLCLAIALASCTAWAQEAGNLFHDPFVQVTSAIAQCPVPRGPYITAEQARVQQHVRSQHGNSCYRSGRCRLPNSYLYDAEIIPRVQTFLRASGRFDDTSLWVLGERRIVSVYGCVTSKEQAIELERAIAHVDDVMNVVPFVMVGSQGKPPYKVAGDSAPD
jgi:hypothetical protein